MTTARLVWIDGKNWFNLPVNCHANNELFINWFADNDEEEGSIVSGYIGSLELHQWKRDAHYRCFHYDRVQMDLWQPDGSCVTICVEDPEATKLFYGLKNFADRHQIDLELSGCLHYGDSPDSYKSWFDIC